MTARSVSDCFFSVYQDGKHVVLDVFPYEPGGSTLYLTADVAVRLAQRLLGAAKEVEIDAGVVRED